KVRPVYHKRPFGLVSGATFPRWCCQFLSAMTPVTIEPKDRRLMIARRIPHVRPTGRSGMRLRLFGGLQMGGAAWEEWEPNCPARQETGRLSDAALRGSCGIARGTAPMEERKRCCHSRLRNSPSGPPTLGMGFALGG